MTGVVYQWHPDVIDDFRGLPHDLKAACLETVEVIKADPKLGEHLERRASTGDLSAYRTVKFGTDTPRGPSHTGSSTSSCLTGTTLHRSESSRCGLDVYNIAANRLDK